MDDTRPKDQWTTDELREHIRFLHDVEIPLLIKDQDEDLLPITRQVLRECDAELRRRRSGA